MNEVYVTHDGTHIARPGRELRLWLSRCGLMVGGLAILCFATLLIPQTFFSWVRDGESIHVRSDERIPESAVEVIRRAESRIRRSALFDPSATYPLYVCNSRWRWNYFSGFNARARGFQTPLGRASFLRPARWDTNKLAGPDGRDGPRPLDVYIAHEITHMMVADHIGLMAGRRLPVWLREGYAEYIARRDTFNYAATRAALIAGDESVSVRDPYWKYLLLVTHLLDQEKLDVRTVLNAPPDPHEVEARMRNSGLER